MERGDKLNMESFDLDVGDFDALLGPSNFTDKDENQLLFPFSESVRDEPPIKGRPIRVDTADEDDSFLTMSTTSSSSSSSSSHAGSGSDAQGQHIRTLKKRDRRVVGVEGNNQFEEASLAEIINKTNDFSISQDHRHELCARVLNHPEVNQKLKTYPTYNGDLFMI